MEPIPTAIQVGNSQPTAEIHSLNSARPSICLVFATGTNISASVRRASRQRHLHEMASTGRTGSTDCLGPSSSFFHDSELPTSHWHSADNCQR